MYDYYYGARISRPVKLTQRQKHRIQIHTGSPVVKGFRIRMGHIYYFTLSTRGSINVCEYDEEKKRYKPALAVLAHCCKATFFDVCLPYMIKHGWRNYPVTRF